MRWGGTFDLDGLRHNLDRLTNLSMAAGFWDDPKRAQKTMRERAGVEETLNGIEKLQREFTDLNDLLEMAAEAGDGVEVWGTATVHADLETKRRLWTGVFDYDLNLIKGGGAALLQEKIVATASARMIVIDPQASLEVPAAIFLFLSTCAAARRSSSLAPVQAPM